MNISKVIVFKKKRVKKVIDFADPYGVQAECQKQIMIMLNGQIM